jgi:hypothetical protein
VAAGIEQHRSRIGRRHQQAVIPSAKVLLTNTATGVARESVTNSAGLYVFPGVTPGPYRLKVELAGLQTFEGSLNVQVQQDATVDVIMQVASAATSVDVVDVTPMVNVNSPSLGSSLERQRIEQLPVNGRGYQNLLVTVPGVQWSSHGHGIGGMVRGNGLRSGSNTLVVDGARRTKFGKAGTWLASRASTRSKSFASKSTTPPRNSHAPPRWLCRHARGRINFTG